MGGRRISQEEFIILTKEIHGNKYDYSQVIYTKKNSKIDIICRKHGMFKQSPKLHLRNQGCPKCAKNTKKTTSQFIKQANRLHENRYIYTSVDYENDKTNVNIECKLHGIFQQRPNNHLSGAGCPLCGIHKNNKFQFQSSNTEEFIKKAKKIHNSKFLYNNVIYKSAKNKIIVTCKKHGNWPISPDNHLRGRGCPECKREKGFGYLVRESDIDSQDIYKQYTIKLSNDNEEFYKTGISKNIDIRFREFIRIGYNVEVIDILIDTKLNCNKIERKLLKKRQSRGKYLPKIKFGGRTECYIIPNI